jgi:hypothetical protein
MIRLWNIIIVLSSLVPLALMIARVFAEPSNP